jgi:hypothetical protein
MSPWAYVAGVESLHLGYKRKRTFMKLLDGIE